MKWTISPNNTDKIKVNGLIEVVIATNKMIKTSAKRASVMLIACTLLSMGFTIRRLKSVKYLTARATSNKIKKKIKENNAILMIVKKWPSRLYNKQFGH